MVGVVVVVVWVMSGWCYGCVGGEWLVLWLCGWWVVGVVIVRG